MGKSSYQRHKYEDGKYKETYKVEKEWRNYHGGQMVKTTVPGKPEPTRIDVYRSDGKHIGWAKSWAEGQRMIDQTIDTRTKKTQVRGPMGRA